jgi:hypothetical protein
MQMGSKSSPQMNFLFVGGTTYLTRMQALSSQGTRERNFCRYALIQRLTIGHHNQCPVTMP